MNDKNKLPPDSDPDATMTGPIGPPKDDPEATIAAGSMKNLGPDSDPEATVTSPLIRDPEQTMTLRDLPFARKAEPPPPPPPPQSPPSAKPVKPEDDPDATFSGPLAKFDPEATITGATGRRRNPFAPKALPEALQANLAALGGLNQLIAFANPIFSAIPQIAAARTHPDPALLKETLQDLIEAFEAGASKAGVGDETLEAAVFALCCLGDDAAASTPWGKDWIEQGLLKEMRGASTGGEAFFALVEEKKKAPEENADLLEFLYVCFALGFQGRYRNAEGTDAAELVRLRSDLHSLISRRRGRPSGLSEKWQPTRSLPVAARGAQSGDGFSWRLVLAPLSALVVLFVAYKIFQPAPATVAPAPPPVAAPTPAPTPAPIVATPAPTPPPPATPPKPAPAESLEAALASEIKGGTISLAAANGRTAIDLRDDRQFGPGEIEPTQAVKALVERIAASLDRAPGPIVVRGYADGTPMKAAAHASNADLSASRAKAVATLLAAKLSRPDRVTSEGAGEADPIAPNDSEENRAKNRRVRILVGPAQ